MEEKLGSTATGALVGATFGRYRLRDAIGAGGMGVVYRATHIDLDKEVAIKTIRVDGLADPSAKARFLREGQAAARIRHPNVVDVYDAGMQDDVLFLVMELLEGIDLRHRLTEGPVTPPEIARILLPISAALHEVHERGIIHRDIKPSNIFLTRGPHADEFPKLLDFGISKSLDRAEHEGLTQPGMILGTLPYISPEQTRGDMGIDDRTDQYTMGVIAYQCATGRLPFPSAPMFDALQRIVQGDFEPLREGAPELPEGLHRLVEVSMATDPKDRYPSMLAFGQQLLSIADPRTQVRWAPVFRLGADTDHGMHHTVATPAPAVDPTQAFDGASRHFDVPGSSAPAPTRTWVPFVGGAAVIAATFLGMAFGRSWGTAAPVSVAPVQVSRAEDASSVARWTPSGAPPLAADAVPSPVAPRPETFQVRIAVEPTTASIVCDGEEVGTGTFERSFDKDGVVHVVSAHAEGFRSRTVRFRDAPPVTELVLPRVARTKAKPLRLTPRSRAERLSKEPPVPAKGTNGALIIP